MCHLCLRKCQKYGASLRSGQRGVPIIGTYCVQMVFFAAGNRTAARQATHIGDEPWLWAKALIRELVVTGWDAIVG